MVSCLDVDANRLIENVAKKLEEMQIEKPEFSNFVKSGAHKERPPTQKNFWYIRCASVLRHTYARGNVGTNRLRRHYGGRKSRGVKPEKHVKAGGSLIRKAMQSLEKAGLVEKKKKGRELTAKGKKLLDQCAKEIEKK
ncbi:MAG: 30S ribosomal protein S19e [Candidatus ainarchaeum sp.]|nr:30S ribosomal protein S19e [Candidatus ainarchaeum sp.]